MRAGVLLAVGFLLGMRHATDADHLVALSTLAGRVRNLRGALLLGTTWGVGHTAAILLAGGAIVLFDLTIPPHVGLGLEMAVAAMLILLGLLNLTRRPHPTGGREPGQPRLPNGGWRPLAIGVVHGLAGSGALALLVLATLPSPLWAVIYLAVFCGGTILGMSVLTAVMAVPLAAVARRSDRVQRLTARLSGGLSLALGLVLAYRLGVVDGLFSGAPHWAPR
jgi:high-affinity nickel-transport protein